MTTSKDQDLQGSNVQATSCMDIGRVESAVSEPMRLLFLVIFSEALVSWEKENFW